MSPPREFAAFGGTPAFARPLHVAQLNLPEWSKVEQAFRELFSRRWFANNGPLVQELDRRLAERLDVGHAICVTSGTAGLMLLARALGSEGEVIVPAFTFPATAQAVCWAGLRPVLADVETDTHMLSERLVAPLLTPRTLGILGVHLWGRACDPTGLGRLAQRTGTRLVFDACHALGCSHAGRRIGGFGDAEVFSLHATKIVSAAEGGFITTDDARLAERLRTMRNFHPSPHGTIEPLRMNAKMSEAQAALALLSLDDLDRNIEANRLRHAAYRGGLAEIPGLELLADSPEDASNFQYAVLRLDARAGLGRDQLLRMLHAENVVCTRHFYPGLHRMEPFASLAQVRQARFPGTELLCASLLQLPNGEAVSVADVERICDLIRRMLADAGRIARRLEEHA